MLVSCFVSVLTKLKRSASFCGRIYSNAPHVYLIKLFSFHYMLNYFCQVLSLVNLILISYNYSFSKAETNCDYSFTFLVKLHGMPPDSIYPTMFVVMVNSDFPVTLYGKRTKFHWAKRRYFHFPTFGNIKFPLQIWMKIGYFGKI